MSGHNTLGTNNQNHLTNPLTQDLDLNNNNIVNGNILTNPLQTDLDVGGNNIVNGGNILTNHTTTQYLELEPATNNPTSDGLYSNTRQATVPFVGQPIYPFVWGIEQLSIRDGNDPYRIGTIQEARKGYIMTLNINKPSPAFTTTTLDFGNPIIDDGIFSSFTNVADRYRIPQDCARTMMTHSIRLKLTTTVINTRVEIGLLKNGSLKIPIGTTWILDVGDFYINSGDITQYGGDQNFNVDYTSGTTLQYYIEPSQMCFQREIYITVQAQALA